MNAGFTHFVHNSFLKTWRKNTSPPPPHPHMHTQPPRPLLLNLAGTQPTIQQLLRVLQEPREPRRCSKQQRTTKGTTNLCDWPKGVAQLKNNTPRRAHCTALRNTASPPIVWRSPSVDSGYQRTVGFDDRAALFCCVTLCVRQLFLLHSGCVWGMLWSLLHT